MNINVCYSRWSLTNIIQKVENELRDICNDVLGLLDKFLIPKVCLVFF